MNPPPVTVLGQRHRSRLPGLIDRIEGEHPSRRRTARPAAGKAIAADSGFPHAWMTAIVLSAANGLPPRGGFWKRARSLSIQRAASRRNVSGQTPRAIGPSVALSSGFQLRA